MRKRELAVFVSDTKWVLSEEPTDCQWQIVECDTWTEPGRILAVATMVEPPKGGV